MAEAEYLLLLDGNALNKGHAVPAKLFEYIRSGRTILAITARNSPVDRILAQSGIPNACVYHDDQPERVDAEVLRLFHLTSEPASPSEWFLSQFDGRRQTEALASILNSVCGEAN